MSNLGPEFITSNLLKFIERDISKYDELIQPLFEHSIRINNPDLDKFIGEFGGHVGAMKHYRDRLKELQKMHSGSKIRRIIRIIFEK